MEATGNHSYSVEYQILSRSEAEKCLNKPLNWWSQQFPNGTVNRQITCPQTYAISTILTVELMHDAGINAADSALCVSYNKAKKTHQ